MAHACRLIKHLRRATRDLASSDAGTWALAAKALLTAVNVSGLVEMAALTALVRTGDCFCSVMYCWTWTDVRYCGSLGFLR